MATLLGAQLLSGLRRRRGNSTGAACWGPGFPGEGAASGGAPGGLAPLPPRSSPDACSIWAGLDVSGRLEEDGDSSLREGNVEEGPKKGQGSSLARWERISHRTTNVLGEKGRHKASQASCSKTWGAKYCWAQEGRSLGERKTAGCPRGRTGPFWEHWKVRRAGAPQGRESCYEERYLSGGVCTCDRNREEMLRDSVLSGTRTGPPARVIEIMIQSKPPLKPAPGHGVPLDPPSHPGK